MKTFTVFIEQYVLETCEVEVEADDYEKAIELATEQAEDGDVIWESDGETRDLTAFRVNDDMGATIWSKE
jgi:hypothetical protein